MRTSPESLQERSYKKLFRLLWSYGLLGYVFLTTVLRRSHSKTKIFYGGARSGNIGGPLVKVKRLRAFFAEDYFSYNMVYTLSNTPYLTTQAIKRLKSKKIPLILNQNGVFYSGWYSGDWQAKNDVMSLAYHQADYVFWQSDFCRRAADRFLGVRNGSGEVLYNAVDTDVFRPCESQIGSQERIKFLCTGKFDLHLGYRLENTVRALSIAREKGLDAELIIAGWVDNRIGLGRIVEMCNVKNMVTLTGPYTQDNAPAVYGMADAYVTLKYLDPCPNAVIEALSCGLPIIYSHSGGVPELVGEDAGIGISVPERWDSIEVPNAEKVADAMIEMSQCLHQARVLARDRAVKLFDIRHWIQRHRDIFEKFLVDE